MRSYHQGIAACTVLLAACVLPDLSGAPASEKRATPWVIAALADNRGGNPTHRKVLECIKKDGAEMVINLGDMVWAGRGGGWDAFMDDMRNVYGNETDAILKNYFVCAGGHEERYMSQSRRKSAPPIRKDDWKYAGAYDAPGYEPENAAGQTFYDTYFRYKERAGKAGSAIRDYDQYGDYHVTYRGLHLLSLYITDEWPVGKEFHPADDVEARKAAWKRQTQWLEERLEAIRKSDPKAPIIIIAHDIFWFDQKGETFLGRLNALLTKYRVDLALCGDGHHYFHVKDPVTLKLMLPDCFTPGRGGYLRIGVFADRLKLAYCHEDGTVLQTFEKRMGKPLEGTKGRRGRLPSAQQTAQ